ncbi:MAG TPA: isoamylase early set domain-containing protein [Gemmatimonadaceae bacterium]
MFDDERDALKRMASELRRPVTVSPTFDARVMAAIRARPRESGPRLWSRLMMPRTVIITPLRWAALVAALVLAASLGVAYGHLAAAGKGVRQTLFAARSHVPAPQKVQFVLVAPTARKVAVVGDFNGWDPTHAAYQARHRGGGVWSVTARVPVGHHRYSFVVDDTVWVPDPSAPRVVDNDFGLTNSALVVEDINP